MTSHLLRLNAISHSPSHSSSFDRSLCKVWQSDWFEMVRYIIVYSSSPKPHHIPTTIPLPPIPSNCILYILLNLLIIFCSTPSASFYSNYQTITLLYSILLYSNLLCCSCLYSTLLYSTSTLLNNVHFFYSTLLCTTAVCCDVLCTGCAVLCCVELSSAQFSSAQFSSALLCSTQLISGQVRSALFCSHNH